ncbi:PREDICTED: zinc finger MYM-type protein 3 isoform X2 [Dinoponera quadriceps]|uniref:Zinc finger MYM-type protein 3 isoform X2 n=1 Tax=Dinoponera quadriceps TaxID=609295 RepID=A0A6P3Y8Y3_DINQU|nr:PREDICTED: zinc finger MYM-type protein 3 isoform X2 [Dinoponera quadriceps]
MEPEDSLVPLDKVDMSQQEIVNNSENKDNNESSIEKVLEESLKPNESQPDKDSTEEICDELCIAQEKTISITSEKDFIPLSTETNEQATCSETTINMEANDHTICLETLTNIETNDHVTCLETTTDVETDNHATCLETTTNIETNDNSPCLETITNMETNDHTICLETMTSMETNDHSTCLETTIAENNTDIEKPPCEENIGIVTSQESNVIKSSCKESTSIDADKETTELISNISNLTEACDIEHLSNIEVSNEDADNTANDGFKSSNNNAASQLEVSSQEKDKNCDIPEECSVNADDIQISQKELDSSKKLESDSDSNLENPDKDCSLSEKNMEPENTEFVQISHDKQDDTQIENQSIDAEDPFGGDNLVSENVEQIEADNLADGEVSFKNIYEQDNNLQDVVNAKNDNCNEKLGISYTSNDPKDTTVNKVMDNTVEAPTNIQSTIDSLVNTPLETDLTNNDASKTDVRNALPIKSTDDRDKQVKKNIEEITSMETDVEQTDVLPGQDDELCIIPDSMKVIIPNKSVKVTESERNESTLVQDSKKDEMAQSNKPDSDVVKDTTQDEIKSVDADNTSSSTESAATIENRDTETAENVVAKATDVINVEDELKSSEEVEEITYKERCKQCNEERMCIIRVKVGSERYNVCSKTCKALFKAANNKSLDIPSGSHLDDGSSKREKRCSTCFSTIELNDERNLSWETMEFCNEECLGKFQRKYGSYCKNCNGSVQHVSLGKYCVRFGCDVRQFCCSTCLEEFKKGLKVCSYCQKDISLSTDGFLAPVGEKGQFKDFCTQDCMEKYSKLNSAEPPATTKKPCSVCQEKKIVHCEVQIYNSSPVAICSEPCFAAFKFVKQVKPEQCSTCKKFFELPNKQNFVVYYENEPHTFCNKTCLNIFIIANRKIVPCNWCKVKKYNFDMIKKELKTGQLLMMCSLNCLTLYQVSINAVSAKRINCDYCKEYSLAHYHLTMSDATIRNFCSYNCVMNFQAQYTKSPITIPSGDDPVPTGVPKRTIPQKITCQSVSKPSEMQKKTMPVISSVTSLAAMGNGQTSPSSQQNSIVMPTSGMPNQTAPVIYKQQIIARPPSPVKVHNKTTQCKPVTHTKGVSVRPHPCTKWTQTKNAQQVVIPIPVPIYVPFPVHMYSMPFPVPMPFPLPIPIPLFIPTTRNSAKGIMKDIKRIQEKIPSDPYEAELLMMAEMVATEKKANDSDSDSVDDSPEAVDSSNTFGDDMLQMALKMATGELDEPAVDLEAALTPNTITATQPPSQSVATIDNDVQSERLITASRGRKRMVPYKPRSTSTKRARRVSGTNDIPLMPPPEPQPPPQPRIMEPLEKPDANMTLKYTFGVNAWRQWVIAKNAELEKQITPMRKIKLFKTDLLQLTADELNYSLCLFVKEVKKPNGAEYAPDTIYYLCLGIQQYLFENNRIDNIFTDSYYEKFTDCLNEIAKKFSMIYHEAQYIVTRVEEEHLWECKQLGAHSPHVLLSTLMFFNTKHFNLVTVEEHMQLSFSHIMKHWKRNPAAQASTAVTGKAPRNVLLRFYPPQSALENNSRKKKVYEQQENEEDPLRCPVKLYEFYLSKCPESVKTRNDVFYLLPERSCVPDSPVWYSTSPLAKEQLIKMLYRIKMVKEINVALLTS